MNALLDQKKTEDCWIDFAGIRHVRVQPMLAKIMDEARPATTGKGDQLIHGALMVVLIKAIVEGRFRYVHTTLGEILGTDSTSVEMPHNGGELTKKPLAKAAGK